MDIIALQVYSYGNVHQSTVYTVYISQCLTEDRLKSSFVLRGSITCSWSCLLLTAERRADRLASGRGTHQVRDGEEDRRGDEERCGEEPRSRANMGAPLLS